MFEIAGIADEARSASAASASALPEPVVPGPKKGAKPPPPAEVSQIDPAIEYRRILHDGVSDAGESF